MRGFSLVEVLIALAIALMVAAGLVWVSEEAQAYMTVQPEVADLSQRGRVAADVLRGEIALAGGGPYRGSEVGALARWVPAIYPDRRAISAADLPRYDQDAVTVLRVPDDAAQGSLGRDMRDGSELLEIASDVRCPVGAIACGFDDGRKAIIFDRLGRFDLFTVDAAGPSQFGHLPARLATAYRLRDGPIVSEVVATTYYYDRARRQLRRSRGPRTDVPIVDQVVDLAFEYYGDPNPPEWPRPPDGVGNCVLDEAGRSRLAVLPIADGALAALPPELLTNGPFCGDGDQPFDADLYRVRRVRVTLRVQVAVEVLRGHDPLLFRVPGVARSASRQVPDLVMRFEVTPRNLQLR